MICKEIDKFETYIRHYLGKEATLKHKQKNIKDLNYLNRDLKNIIVIDKDPENVKKHLSNLIVLPEFLGDPNDQELKYIIPFLKGKKYYIFIIYKFRIGKTIYF